MKKLILLAVLAVAAVTASAYDIIVDGIAYNFNGDELTVTNIYDGLNYEHYDGDIVIPDSVTYEDTRYAVTAIGAYAFSQSGVLGVEIPNTITSIGDKAFYQCTYLTSIEIPNSISAIGENVFEKCTSLTSIKLPDAMTEIPNGLLSGCSKITSIDIPASVTKIGNYAFYDCKLTSFDFDAITEIGANAFARNKFTSLVIPNTVTKIGGGAFSDCSSLASIKLSDAMTEISSSLFANCSALSGITIPSLVTEIGYEAFKNCSALTSVTIPGLVTRLGRNAFEGCSSLTIVTLPCTASFELGDGYKYDIESGNVKEYYTYPFYSCPIKELNVTGNGHWWRAQYGSGGYWIPDVEYFSNLETLNIGSGVTSLGNCQLAPATINCYAEVPPTCTQNTFAGYDGALHVPAASMAAYFTADYWQNFNNLSADLTSKVIVSETAATITLNTTHALTASTLPEGQAVVWWSSNSAVATVDAEGVVTAISEGECDIFATLQSNDVIYSSCHVTAVYPEITVTLSEQEVEINLGEQLTLEATITPADLGLTATWASSNESVATVDEDGVVNAVGDGECDITATVRDKSATCHVVVNGNVIITLDMQSATIQPNGILTLTPTATPDVEVDLVATSSNPAVAVARVANRTAAPAVNFAPAAVSSKVIQVIGLAEGTATITVGSADGKATPAIVEVTVSATTGIEAVNVTNKTVAGYYDMQGRRHNAPVQGVNIVRLTDGTVIKVLVK